MARHEAPTTTFDAVVSDYVTGRAKELIREFDAYLVTDDPLPPGWCGAAAEILRELTRDA